MVLLTQSGLLQIKSNKYVDLTQAAHQLGFACHFKIYVSQYVWERYIRWTYDDDQFFNVHQLQEQRQEKILKDALTLMSVCGQEQLEKELFFNRHIIVRKEQLTVAAQPELALFKINSACNENNDDCLIIDAVNIT